MENKPEISIIVPMFNSERHIEGCLDSIAAQTLKNYEVILVNDGSTDRTAEICREYQARDSRIKYIEKENGGAGSARNAGMDAACGKYLAFPDVDDSFEPEMYRELFDLAESGGYDVVFSGVNYYRQSDGGRVYSRTQNIKAAAFCTQRECRENIMTFFPTTTIFDVPWNKLYRRSVAVENNIRFPDLKRCQDAMFNLDFFNCVSSAASVDRAYYNYLENTEDDVHRKFPKNYIDVVISYYTHLIDRLEGWGVYSGKIRTHYDTTFVLAIYNAAKRFDNPLWKLSKAERGEYINDILNRTEIGDFILGAQVRQDAQEILDLLKNKDVKAIINNRRREAARERLRKNRVIMAAYRQLRVNARFGDLL